MKSLRTTASAITSDLPGLSAELRTLSEHCRGQPRPLGELLDVLGGRAPALLIIVCALPFLTPIPLPGLSTAFGLVILLLSYRCVQGQPLWLPHRIRRVEVSGQKLAEVLAAGSRLVGWLERRIASRFQVLVDTEWKHRLHMAVVVVSALLLMIPLPPVPPFTNLLPALVVIVMTFSVFKRDGLGVLVAYVLLAVTLIYFSFWAALVVQVVESLIATGFGS